MTTFSDHFVNVGWQAGWRGAAGWDLLFYGNSEQKYPISQLSWVLSDDLERWGGGRGGGRDAQEKEDIGERIADSLCCTAEINTTL